MDLFIGNATNPIKMDKKRHFLSDGNVVILFENSKRGLVFNSKFEIIGFWVGE